MKNIFTINFTFLVIFFMSLCELASADSGHTATLGMRGNSYSNGCWDGRHDFINGGDQCMQVVSSKWSGSDNTKMTVKYQNTCSYRIYAKMCNQRSNGTYDCGASGIKPGATKNWYTYSASGRYTYIAVGSDKPSQDWNCSSEWGGDTWKNMGK